MCGSLNKYHSDKELSKSFVYNIYIYMSLLFEGALSMNLLENSNLYEYV